MLKRAHAWILFATHAYANKYMYVQSTTREQCLGLAAHASIEHLCCNVASGW